MCPPATHYVGADVAKDTITFCGPTAATIDNTPGALDAYLHQLPVPAHLICEATGRCHHLLQARCAHARIALSVLNPMHVRSFARSLGKLEKTDRLDAAILRRFGEERRPAPSPPPDPARQQLLDLLMVWQALAGDLCAYRHRVQTLCLVKGVGVLSALQLVAYLPELGRCNRRQIAKLAGLAPLPWDSGQLHGVRRIQHGRSQVRRVLYPCAVVAARWNETLRPHYQQLRARGLAARPAYCAVARKLLVLLNASLRTDSQ
jgi:transposase